MGTPRDRAERTIKAMALSARPAMPPIMAGRTMRLTAEQQSAPPRSELMQNTMDSIVFSPRSSPQTLNALALSPRNVSPGTLARHMRGEDVPVCSGGNNAILREGARRRDNFSSRTVQLLNPIARPSPRDNPPHPEWWTGNFRWQQAEQHASLEPHPPASPPPRHPQPLPAADPVEAAAAARLQHEVRAHQAVKREERAQNEHAATVVQRHSRGIKGRRKYLTEKDRTLSHYHKLLQKHIQTRFSSYARCFRMIDADSSGAVDPTELKTLLPSMFNLTVPEPVMDQLIALTDKDGDGEIRFAEFARVFSADDIHQMKRTLQAAGGESRILQAMRDPLSETNMPMPIKVYNSHFAPGAFVPSVDASAATSSFVPRGFPQGTDLRPPPRARRLQNAFRLGLKASVRDTVWHPRTGALALPAGKKSDVHQPLTLAWHPSQLGVGVDEPGISGTTLKWLGVKEAPL